MRNDEEAKPAEMPEELFQKAYGGKTFAKAIAQREHRTPGQNLIRFIVAPALCTSAILVALGIVALLSTRNGVALENEPLAIAILTGLSVAFAVWFLWKWK